MEGERGRREMGGGLGGENIRKEATCVSETTMKLNITEI